MSDAAFDKVSAMLGAMMDQALKDFMGKVLDANTGKTQIASLSPRGDFEPFTQDELKQFVAQIGGCEFGFGFRSKTPKLNACVLKPAVIGEQAKPGEIHPLGISGSIGISGTITF